MKRTLICMLAALLLAPAAALADTPNVLVVMTDDQRADDLAATPQTLAEIRDQGTEYVNNYASDPNCCPSRTTFITGQYAHNHGVVRSSNNNPGYDALDQSNTLGPWMQAAGYRTGLIGKYLNPWSHITPATPPPGWDTWVGLLNPHHQMWDFDLDENGTINHYDSPIYKDDVLADRAATFLADDSDQPFFLWYAPPAPHNSEAKASRPEAGRCATHAQPAPEYLGAFDDSPLPRPASFMEADTSDKNSGIQAFDALGRGYADREGLARQCRLESLLSVDRDVDRFVTELADAGELDNTIIIFTSDNGFFYGEHRVPSGKLRAYDPSTKVPLYVRGPGFGPGVKVQTPTTNVDLAATITAATGATAGRALDGADLRTLPAKSNRTVLLEMPFTSADDNGHLGGGPVYAAAVNRLWELIDYPTDPMQEFYDRTADPDQLDGTLSAAEAAHLAPMQSKLKRLRKCAGAACDVDR